MATIIKIGDTYVNLDAVTSISFIRDREVCIHNFKGEPRYITTYYSDEVREILEGLAKRTKKEAKEG